MFTPKQLQYQAMGLCDSYEEESTPKFTASSEEAVKFFDDPTYVLGDQNKRKVLLEAVRVAQMFAVCAILRVSC